MTEFAQHLLTWFQKHGRTDLPWQQNPTPYRVWVSEIMLQQTQVSTVIPYYLKFMSQFPSVEALASSPLDQVLHYWSGLGYYARARNLHKAAGHICEQKTFPQQFDQIIALPGIGRSTAGAILALAFHQPFSILDGNAKRVLARYHAISGWPGKPQVLSKLWTVAEHHTPRQDVARYTQAIMDLGATLCTRTSPACSNCPLSQGCIAYQQGASTAYPHKKPKTQKPSKSTRFLIILNDSGAALLEKRPNQGIWGGLWSFPECSEQEEPVKWCVEKYQCETTHIKDLPPFQHVFTHFKLVIYPTLLQGSDELASTKDTCWYDAESEQAIGFPAPVQTLLQTLLS